MAIESGSFFFLYLFEILCIANVEKKEIICSQRQIAGNTIKNIQILWQLRDLFTRWKHLNISAHPIGEIDQINFELKIENVTNLKHRQKDVSMIPFKFVNCFICVYEFYEQLSQFDLIQWMFALNTALNVKLLQAIRIDWHKQKPKITAIINVACGGCVCMLVKYRLSSFFHEIFEWIQNSMWYSSVFRGDNLSQKFGYWIDCFLRIGIGLYLTKQL